MVRIRDSFKYGVFAVALAFGSVGCDDEETTGPTPPPTAKVNVSAATTTAVAGKKFTFASGVPALGTTGSTEVTFTSSSAATVVAGGKTSMAMVKYGSCIFTFPACAMPAVEPCGMKTVSPCSIEFDGNADTAKVTLGGTVSSPTAVGDVKIECMAGATTCNVSVCATGGGACNMAGTVPVPTGSMGGG